MPSSTTPHQVSPSDMRLVGFDEPTAHRLIRQMRWGENRRRNEGPHRRRHVTRGGGRRLKMFRLEEELLVGASALARLVDDKTGLTLAEKSPVRVMDDERKWFGRGDPAPSGDYGGDMRIEGSSYSNLGWAQLIEASHSGYDNDGEPETRDLYSVVSMGTWYRYIQGILSTNDEGDLQTIHPWRVYISDITAGWDGDTSLGLSYDSHFVRPDTEQESGQDPYLTLSGACITPVDGLFFRAIFDSIALLYRVVLICCPPEEEE